MRKILLTIFLICLSLSGFSRPAMAGPPTCPTCQYWDGYRCRTIWCDSANCMSCVGGSCVLCSGIPGLTCCNGGCCDTGDPRKCLSCVDGGCWPCNNDQDLRCCAGAEQCYPWRTHQCCWNTWWLWATVCDINLGCCYGVCYDETTKQCCNDGPPGYKFYVAGIDEQCCYGSSCDPANCQDCNITTHACESRCDPSETCCEGTCCDPDKTCCSGSCCDPANCEECDGSGYCLDCEDRYGIGYGCCGGECYDTLLQGCCDGHVYFPLTHGCCNGVLYDRSTHQCCPGGYICDKNKECCNGDCCNNTQCCDPSGCVEKCINDAAVCEFEIPDWDVVCREFNPTANGCGEGVEGILCGSRIEYWTLTAKCADCDPGCAKTYIGPCALIYPVRCEEKLVLWPVYTCLCTDEDATPQHSGAREQCLLP